MTITYFTKKKFHFLFITFFAVLVSGLQAQTAPENTRLMQLNTNSTGTLSKSYLRHLDSQKSDLFFSCIVEGNANFFGQQINNASGVKSRHIARLGEDGLPRWTAKFSPDLGIDELNLSDDFACTDLNDNFLFLGNASASNSVFTDASGTTINFSQGNGNTKALIKVNKDGNYLWSKKIFSTSSEFKGAIATDNNGEVYLIINRGFYTIDNITIGTSYTNTFSVIKLSGVDGSILYSKSYNYNSYTYIPVFDSENNLYVFTEPYNNVGDYIFDTITVPNNNQSTGHVMLKFNAQGDVVFGKNFYANATNYNYSWANDVVFDGTNFILHGTLFANTSTDFVGLDGVIIPRSYPGITYQGLIAKVDTSGTVLWQKPIETNMNTPQMSYNNIDQDEDHNFYVYYSGVKDKLKINGTEYNFDVVRREKVLIKFDTNGNQDYLKAVDFGNQHTMIDVFGVDKVNVSSFTTENNIQNYPVNNLLSSNLYIATFGIINTPYLQPVVNHSEVNDVAISNNGSENTTFSFDLVNNVNWTATSNQPWLSLSHLNLTGKNALDSTISGSEDARITLTAEPNTTGSDRTATVTISGTGVATKTILVTQSGILSTPSNEFNANALVLYPNPAHSSIAFSEPVKELEITDVSGKTIKVFKGFNSDYTINDLAKGIYFVKGTTQNDSRFIKKLIKE